ncbi:ABC transporter ATP-binding protein [Asticcacaulis solisilvae]|uniref:ABC transporter ATP-binding protein n=1 Tax=Asticcacaulis solisilvae TaxID=1217274 RepID=UPI003FD7F971
MTERRRYVSQVRMYLRMFAHYKGVLAGLSVIGLISSLAETIGISVAVMLLTSALSGGALLNKAGILSDIYRFVGHHLGNSLVTAGLVIFGLALLRTICGYIYVIVGSWVQHAISHEMRERIYASYMETDYHTIMKMDRGELINRLTMESWSIAETLFLGTRLIVTSATALIFGAFIVVISWKLAVIAVVGAGTILTLARLVGKPADAESQKIVTQKALMSDRVVSDIQGMRTIRAFAREDDRKAAFVGASDTLRRFLVKIDYLYAWIDPVNEIGYVLLLGALLLGAAAFHVPAPSVLAAIIMMYRVQPSLREFNDNRLALTHHLAALNVVSPIVDPRGRRREDPGTLPCPELTGEIAFEGVTYRFGPDGRDVLSGLDIRIPLGGVTILAGNSGAGKSTLLNLLLRLYRPNDGRIVVSGVPLSDIRRDEWLGRIAVAGQDVDLIVGSIEENLTLNRPGIAPDDVARAIAICGLEDVMEHLPEGLKTSVGDRGLALSGGQRQRLGLARALLGRPDILILDEALGAVQGKMEREIYDRILTAFAGRTLIVVTHRPDVLPKPDQTIYITAAPSAEPSAQYDRYPSSEASS